MGILGGTFDPVHVGHLVAALEARCALALDRVLLVVAGDPWQKQGEVVAPAEDRIAMVAAALEGVAGLEASRIELDRPGPTYTIETVEALQKPGRDLFLIVGSDAAAGLPTWHRAADLRAVVTLAIVDRGDQPADPGPGWRVERVGMPRLDISSTDLRARLAQGRPVDFLVPSAAVRVMSERGLYTRR